MSEMRPLVGLPVAGSVGHGEPAAARQDTVLPEEPDEILQALGFALREGTGDDRARERLAALAAAHPATLEVWARLSELALRSGDPVTAYAFARVAYHRGLDRLRRHGWGGTGAVRWAHPSNRPFLRGLRALLAAAAALDEEDEAGRCRGFLLELDPEDGIGAAGYPEVPGSGWIPPDPPG